MYGSARYVSYQKGLKAHLSTEDISCQKSADYSAKMTTMDSTQTYVPLSPFFVRGHNLTLIARNKKSDPKKGSLKLGYLDSNQE